MSRVRALILETSSEVQPASLPDFQLESRLQHDETPKPVGDSLDEILANFGLNAYLIREVSQDRARTSGYLLNTTVLRIFTGLFASLPILLYVWGAGLAGDTLAAVLFLMVGMVFSLSWKMRSHCSPSLPSLAVTRVQ